jgi:hypothetical protein
MVKVLNARCGLYRIPTARSDSTVVYNSILSIFYMYVYSAPVPYHSSAYCSYFLLRLKSSTRCPN